MISNKDLIAGYLSGTMNGRKNGSMSISDDGRRLFSYATCIAEWSAEQLLVNITKYSVTTSKQQGILNRSLGDYVGRGGDVAYVDGLDRGTRYLNK